MIVLRPSSKKTTSAAVRAASEAPSTAIPQSAFLSEGASSMKWVAGVNQKERLREGVEQLTDALLIMRAVE